MTIAGRVRSVRGATSPTAELCAVVRAAEHQRPPSTRLLHDPHAHCFLRNRRFRLAHALGLLGFGVRRADRRYTGLLAEIVLRHRHCDEVLAEEIADGCRQVVVLGAGYDTTALRTGLPADVRTYEVDKPDTQAEKIAILHRNRLRPDVHYVSCDFDSGDNLAQRLVAAGFDPGSRCLVLWMGVTYYLTRGGVLSTLSTLERVSAPGSALVLDYLDADVVEGSAEHSGAQRGRRLVASGGEPFTFGAEPGEADELCAPFTVRAHHRVPDLLHAYGDPGSFWLTPADYQGVLTLRR